MCSVAAKSIVVDRKNRKALARLYLASGPRPNVANLSVVRPSSQQNKDKVLEGQFRTLNFSPSTKKTTEYSFDFFLSIYRHLIFFLKFVLLSKLSS